MTRAVRCAGMILALVAAAGCKRDGAGAGAGSDAATAGPTPSRAWVEGRLPPEVEQGTPRPGGTLTIRIWTEPSGLTRIHDQMAEGWMARYTVGTVYETLAELDRDTHPRYELKPLLAEEWKVSPDGLTSVVRLRKGVRFHNGEPFTSRDVKAVMDVVTNPKNLTATARSFFTDLESYTTPDEHTVVLRWKRPYFLAFRNFVTHLPMMPASALQGDFDTLAIHRAPIGTGPFRFGGWEAGRSITFLRNDEYWGQRAYLDRVVLRIVRDHTVATQMFERGEFDLMTLIQPTVWRSIERPLRANAWAIEGYHRIRFVENNYGWLGWNLKRPLFQDVRVRKALGLLVPYEQVERNIDLGLEDWTTCPYYRESDSCDRTVQRLPYDPATARRLLGEAGWVDSNGDGVLDRSGVPFKFTFMINPHSVKMAKLAPLLQSEYRKVGIDMDIEKVDTALYLERMRRHEFDLATLMWSTLDPEADQYQVFHSTQAKGGSNYVSYANAEVDELLAQVRATLDPAARAALNRRIHRRVFEDQPYTFLTSRPALDAVKRHVRGIRPSLAWYDLRRIWLAPPAGKSP